MVSILPRHHRWMAPVLIVQLKGKWAEVFHWAVTNGYTFLPYAESGETNQQPVQLVNWLDGILWCNARSQKEGLNPCYYTDGARNAILTNPLPPFCTNWSFGNASVDGTANGYRLPTEAEWEKAARGRRQGRLFPWGGDTIQHARANYYATNSFAYDTSPTSGFHPYYLAENAFQLRCAVRKKESLGVAYGDYGFRCVRTD